MDWLNWVLLLIAVFNGICAVCFRYLWKQDLAILDDYHKQNEKLVYEIHTLKYHSKVRSNWDT